MQPVSSFSSSVLTEILRRQPASKEKTAFAWQLVVGPAIARATSVGLQNGVLVVVSRDERWAKEVVRAKDGILARLQQLLGPDVIHTIRT